VFADTSERFLGQHVRPLSELSPDEVDAVIIATFERPEPHVETLARLGIPRERCLVLRRLAGPGTATNGR
jgi:hypothetical protein